MNKLFSILLGISTIGLAFCAAFFSITGLSKMFGGAETEVIIMASFLEFSKIVTAGFLHIFWGHIKTIMKIQLTVVVIILMVITSAGIYGFLSNSYNKTGSVLNNINAKTELFNNNIGQKNNQILSIENIINSRNNRIEVLNKTREQQENQVLNFYSRNQNTNAKRLQQDIRLIDLEINDITKQIDSLNNVIVSLNTEINDINLSIMENENNDIKAEIGALLYISNITNTPIEKVVNWFILLLIFVFDPLAVTLVVATNIAVKKSFEQKKTISNNMPVSENIVTEKEETQPIKKEEPKIELPKAETPNQSNVKETTIDRIKKIVDKKPSKPNIERVDSSVYYKNR
jgi:hypothetical protein